MHSVLFRFEIFQPLNIMSLTNCMLGNFTGFLSSVYIFQMFFFSNKSNKNTITVSSSLDPDQARHLVGPDLGSNCLLRLSVDDIGRQRI